MTVIIRRLKTETGTFNNFMNIWEQVPNQSIGTGTRTSSLPKETVLIFVNLCVEEH